MSVPIVVRIAIDERDSVEPTARLDRVFHSCRAALYRYIRVRVGDDHTADDLMQQLWLSARRGAAHVPEERLEFSLRAIAANLVRTHWRRARVRRGDIPIADPRLAGELADRLADEQLPADLLERQEARDQLLLALTELSAVDQELLIGFHFDNRPYAELAESLGLSVRAIEGRLFRSRAALREALASLRP